MKTGKVLYALLCAAGGALVGCFAGRLSTVWGALLFALGVALMVFGIIKSGK